MAQHRYMGPARTVDGKPVPKDGLVITAAQRKGLPRWHQFADDEPEAEKPTPQEVNDAATDPKAKDK